MSIYNDKTILIVGGLNLIDAPFITRLIEAGAKEVRVLDGTETTVQELRENLEHETCNLKLDAQRLRFFVGDLTDNAYMEEAMSGVGYVLYVPAIPRAFDCEVAPAQNTITFLETVTGVTHTAIDCGVEKLVVVSPARQEPLTDLPAMLAALMESVVVAEVRYLGPDSATAIFCARMDEDKATLAELADYTFETAKNGDLFIQTENGIECKPCQNFEMIR